MVNFRVIAALGAAVANQVVLGTPLPLPADEAAPAAAKVKVMPFGASIASGCWRAYLWQKLQDNNIKNIDFVGTQKGGDCAGIDYDRDHEGHPGAQAKEFVDNKSLPGWLNSSGNPDVILVHLGTNDVINKTPTADIIKAFSTLVDQMRAAKSSVKIVFAQILPLADRFGSVAQKGITDLNKAIAVWGPTKSTVISPITIIDTTVGWNVTTDTDDGEHPNAVGSPKFAAKYYPATVAAIKSVST
ncbi:SGNH hydrolase-type esterase domain-containing protein [Lophiotrema nucula]|uniref:SGNH hydrolase-type esterase domain-containing protein n=1 Tax=Lophiotrema nucula TaxID=690887 RepID=A0A6A5ZTE0_9PLEO|nr:SGNH hydrolase-type esterase domain-containing protein [Lophiotrema nucula]